MKKKLAIVFLFTILLSGCFSNSRNNSHIHTYDANWISTPNGHYRICVYSGCNERSGISSHKYDENGICTVCGYDREQTSGHKHQWSEVEIVKASTCSEAGRGKRKCIVCDVQEETSIKPLGHDFRDDESGKIDATCTESGSKNQTCIRCGDKKTCILNALGHDWVDNEIGTTAPTCTEDGIKNQTCSRCGAKNNGVVIPALGHDYITNEGIEVGGEYARLQVSQCFRCNKGTVIWNANDVDDACKNDKRIVNTEEAANDADPIYEPNYIQVDDDSVTFWGRPIHNALELEDGGSQGAQVIDETKVYDPSIVGSFLEYKFVLENDILNAKLISDFAINPYLSSPNKVFTNLSTDWTLGLIDSDGNYYDTRYIISIDGQILEQDLSLDLEAPHDRSKRTYEFPLKNKINLTKGEHTFRITMAGGWKPSFYDFGFEF